MSFLDILFLPLIFFVGHAVINRVVRVYRIESERRLLTQLFYYHILFSLVYGWYVTSFGGDAVGYWSVPYRSTDWLEMHKPGTSFIRFMTYPFSQILGLSFWTGNLMFSLFGFGGFVLIYLSLLKFTKINPVLFGYKLFPLLLFLPNMHFWSAGIGKDSVIFFALALFIFSMINPTRNIPGIALSFYLVYFIRPHIALLMLVGMAFSLLVSTKGISLFWRVIFLAGSVYAFVLISPAVFEFIGLDEENLEGVGEIGAHRSVNSALHTVGSAIDISNYSVGLKILTFFFRPLFFDAGNIFGFIVSIENAFYLVLALALFKLRNLVEIVRMPMHLKAALFVLGSTAFFMSSSLGNLGLIIRQKNMVMFMFVLIAVFLISKAQEGAAISAPVRGDTMPYAKAKTA